MEQTAARKRAKELNDSGKYDTVFVAMTEAHLRGQFDTNTANWVVVEQDRNGSSMAVVES